MQPARPVRPCIADIRPCDTDDKRVMTRHGREDVDHRGRAGGRGRSSGRTIADDSRQTLMACRIKCPPVSAPSA